MSRTRFYLRERFGGPDARAGEANHPFRSKWALIWFLLTERVPRWGFIGWKTE